MTPDRWILLVITIVQLIHIIGRWSGKIDVSSTVLADKIDKTEKTQYRHTQWQQEAAGKIGLIERELAVASNDIAWIKKLADRRN